LARPGLHARHGVHQQKGRNDWPGIPALALGPTGAPVISYLLDGPTAKSVHLTRKMPDGTWSPQVVMWSASALADAIEILPSGTARILYTQGTVNQTYQSYICF
jgi:hypothetical protein